MFGTIRVLRNMMTKVLIKGTLDPLSCMVFRMVDLVFIALLYLLPHEINNNNKPFKMGITKCDVTRQPRMFMPI